MNTGALPLFAVPAHLPATERARLSRQCQTILQRLEQGPVTNTELVTIACQYNARILELRRAGYVIRKTDQNHNTGVSTYQLEAGI